MCEAIILSIAFLGGLFLGGIVGAISTYMRVLNNTVTTPSGNKIQLWSSILTPGETYVACNMDKNNKWLDGDCVTFDKNGRINYIRTSWKQWKRGEE